MRDLAGAQWIGTSVTVASEAELGPLFAKLGLPAPKIEIQAHSALTMVMAAASSDMLTMLPQQWRISPLVTALLHVFDVTEKLRASPICIVRRMRLPLTPAAEYFCDMIRRAALHHSKGGRVRHPQATSGPADCVSIGALSEPSNALSGNAVILLVRGGRIQPSSWG